MKAKLNISLLALAASVAPGLAIAGEDIDTLAEVCGMSERHVRMLVGPARSPYAESRYAFERIERDFVEVVGEERYRDLLAGKPVRFEREVEGRIVSVFVQIAPRT